MLPIMTLLNLVAREEAVSIIELMLAVKNSIKVIPFHVFWQCTHFCFSAHIKITHIKLLLRL